MTFLLFCFLFWGCSKPHIYPVCFFQSAPDRGVFDTNYAPNLEKSFRTAIGDNSNHVPLTITTNGRWIVAKVTSSQDKKLRKVWPRIGCLGDATDSPSTKAEADCVGYIEYFLNSHSYFEFGNAKDAGDFDIWNESPVKDTVVTCYSISR